MARSKISLKTGKFNIYDLTSDEYYVILDLLHEIKDTLQKDGDEYSVGDRFIFTATEEEYKTIMNLDLWK